MADYYPVLSRAVSSLANNNAPARHELYERVRTMIVEQLLGQDPPKSALEIMRERGALDTAIRKVEVESRSAQIRTPNGQTPHQPTAAVADHGDDIGIRREPLAKNGANAWPAPAKPEEIDTSKKPITNAANEMGGKPESPGTRPVGAAPVIDAQNPVSKWLVLTNDGKRPVVHDRIYVFTVIGVQVFSAQGQYLGTINVPTTPSIGNATTRT
jgi:hypothetical protein